MPRATRQTALDAGSRLKDISQWTSRESGPIGSRTNAERPLERSAKCIFTFIVSIRCSGRSARAIHSSAVRPPGGVTAIARIMKVSSPCEIRLGNRHGLCFDGIERGHASRCVHSPATAQVESFVCAGYSVIGMPSEPPRAELVDLPIISGEPESCCSPRERQRLEVAQSGAIRRGRRSLKNRMRIPLEELGTAAH
jgi:hypothetical protein